MPITAPKINTIPVDEFREFGFLQEVNRQFLHPLGLALEVIIDAETGAETLGRIWDYRDDPEGIIFDPGTIDAEKAERVLQLQKTKAKTREASLGYVRQSYI